MPAGKINIAVKHYHRHFWCLRKDRPVSLVSAFGSPIQSSQGYVEQSL